MRLKYINESDHNSAVLHTLKPGMLKSLLGRESRRRVDDHELADKVDHVGERLAVTVLHELVDEVDLLYLNAVVWTEGCLASAHEVHDAPEGPAVYLEVTVGVHSSLWCAPLLAPGASCHLAVRVLDFDRHVEVDQFDPEWLPRCSCLRRLRGDRRNHDVVGLQVPVADVAAVEMLGGLEQLGHY